jgi:hypothetical protein
MTARPWSSTWKPRLENGTRTSTNHPSSVMTVSASQNVSQLPLRTMPSSDARRSKRIAAALTPNHFAFWLSLKAST